MMKVIFALLLSSTAAMADGPSAAFAKGAPPIFGVRPANAPMVMVGPSVVHSITNDNEEKRPVCHRVRRGLSTCEGGHSVTDLDGVTTFYSADMMRAIGTIQMTGAVKP